MTNRMKRSLRTTLLRTVVVGGALALAAVVAVSWWIGVSVREASAAAVGEFGGDRVEALIKVVDAPAHPLTDRNRAVWALGQLGDPRALAFLQARYTGAPCDHDHALCQHELRKAIDGCSGGFNLSALVWRHASVRSGTS